VNPNATAAIWHDGSKDPDMKFVLRNCRFDGPPDWILSRHHRDAQYFLIRCTFSATMRDRAPYRVIYPLGDGEPTTADVQRNRELDPVNRWGERVYYSDCHREGGDYPWHANNLTGAPGAPAPSQITARWTFAGTWDPERTDRPAIRQLATANATVSLGFTESVTVKGHPQIRLRDGRSAVYFSGSGSDTLTFSIPQESPAPSAPSAIVATEAGALLRVADLSLPE
jgi:pectinesterase